MAIFLIILIVVAAILLTLLILVQNSKGGGLASGFTSGNQVMGAPKTADFLEKATWGLIAIIVVLSILAVAAIKKQNTVAPDESRLSEQAADEVSVLQQEATATPAFGEDAEAEGEE